MKIYQACYGEKYEGMTGTIACYTSRKDALKCIIAHRRKYIKENRKIFDNLDYNQEISDIFGYKYNKDFVSEYYWTIIESEIYEQFDVAHIGTSFDDYEVEN